jgi:hypothetical protein
VSRKEREQAEVDAKRKAEDDAEAKLRREREQKVLTRHRRHTSSCVKHCKIVPIAHAEVLWDCGTGGGGAQGTGGGARDAAKRSVCLPAIMHFLPVVAMYRATG